MKSHWSIKGGAGITQKEQKGAEVSTDCICEEAEVGMSRCMLSWHVVPQRKRRDTGRGPGAEAGRAG